MKLRAHEEAFFALVRAGLWEKQVALGPLAGQLDYEALFKLSAQQWMNGIVTAGMGRATDMHLPESVFCATTANMLRLEARNTQMNALIASLWQKLQAAGLEVLLVKGQGVAQCYERPLWRTSGDIDMLMDAPTYHQAKKLLLPLATGKMPEIPEALHLALLFDKKWIVELHGSLRTGLGRRIDRVVDAVQEGMLSGRQVRFWDNGGTQIPLPAPDGDVIFIFTHMLTHFFKGGIGIRQLCDWCRLLWTFRDTIDRTLLEERLRKMGVLSEWKAFAAAAVDWLGMPPEAMPFYAEGRSWKRKARKIIAFMLESGNLGHNRDDSYRKKYPYLVLKAISLWRYTRDSVTHFFVFPLDSLRIWWTRVGESLHTVSKGK